MSIGWQEIEVMIKKIIQNAIKMTSMPMNKGVKLEVNLAMNRVPIVVVSHTMMLLIHNVVQVIHHLGKILTYAAVN